MYDKFTSGRGVRDDVVVRDLTAEPLPDEPSIQIIQVDRKECRISQNGFFKPSEALASTARIQSFEG